MQVYYLYKSLFSSFPSASDTACEAARVLSFKKSSPNLSLGISTIGGNAVGIFVHEVQPQSFAFGHDGLHCCDQILEVSILAILYKLFFILK